MNNQSYSQILLHGIRVDDLKPTLRPTWTSHIGMIIISSNASSSSNPEPTISNNNGGFDNPHLPHMPITIYKLNGHIYFQWSQSVSMFICGKGRDDYIIGVANCPAKEDSTYKQWKSENSMVMSWLINSMINDIGENFLLYETAKEIWDAAKQTYSNRDNTA